MKLNLLIIGCGNFGSRYLSIIFNKYKRSNIYIHDINKSNIEKCKKNYPTILVLKDFKNIKNLNINGVIIATPADKHLYFVKLCIKNKLNFLCEKPLDVNLSKWKNINYQIKKMNIISAVAYPRRHSNGLIYLKKLIKEKKIGIIKSFNTNYSQDFIKYKPYYINTYYKNIKKGGGILLDALSHHINMITYLFGEIDKINIISKKMVIKKIDGFDFAIIIVEFKNKILGSILGNQFQKPNYDIIEVIGTKGNIKFNRISGVLEILTNDKKPKTKLFKENWDDLLFKQIKLFIKSINKDKNYMPSSIEEEINKINFLIKNNKES